VPGRTTADAVRRQAADGSLEPLYLITGNDEIAISDLAGVIADSVEEDFRAFNVQRFYGSDGNIRLAAVLDAASTLPLLSPRRVVVLLQAERVLSARKRGAEAEDGEGEGEGDAGAAKGQLGKLKEYAAHPHAHATVVIAGVGLGGKAYEFMTRQAACVVCEGSFDVIAELSAQFGVRFDRDAAALLKERAVSNEVVDAARLRDDVERVVLFAGGRQQITRAMVAEVVGRPTAAGGWTLSNHVGSGNAAGALRELDLLLADGGVPFVLLGMLRSTVERKVASRDLPRALDALMRTDLALKTSAGEPRVLLERLVVELCATGRERY
jgi:DNA polymerase III delta subunit